MNIVWKTSKVIGLFVIIIVIMVSSQILGSLWHLLDLKGVEYLLHGLTYLGLFILLVWLFIHKGLKRSLTEFRIDTPRLIPFTLVLGIILTVGVRLLFILCVPGTFYWTPLDGWEDYLASFTYDIWISGMVAPIVEEMVFRGILMKYLEEKVNLIVALVLPSFLFAMVHFLNGSLPMSSGILLLISGTVVGLMFGLAAYTFKTVWASIMLHMCWNLGGLLYITPHKESDILMQYVLNENNVLLTGGAYGIETSILTIIGYILVSVCLMMRYRLKNELSLSK